MRIAMVSEHASPLAVTGSVDAGGQNVHVAALAASLSELGHEVTVFTRRDEPHLPTRVRTADGYVVEHVPAGPARFVPKDDLLPYMDEFGRYLARRMTEDPADVMHAHFWMSASAALLCRSFVGVPVAVTFHALGVVKRRYQGAEDSSPRDRIDTEARVSATADHVIATSDEEVVELRRLGMPIGRSSVVPCGVDTDHFTPQGSTWERDWSVPRALVVSRLVPRKGIDDAIRAVSLLDDVELLIAGGPRAADLPLDVEARRLAALAEDLGVAHRVTLLGQVGRAEMPSLIRSADTVIATPWYEPFGLVALEAMACGVPVIASRVGGLADTVLDGVTGIHVPARDPEAIAMALALLRSNDALAQDLGSAAALHASATYTWQWVAQQTLAAYELTSDPAQAWPATVNL